MSLRTLWCLTLAVFSVAHPTSALDAAHPSLWQRIENAGNHIPRFLLNEDEMKACLAPDFHPEFQVRALAAPSQDTEAPDHASRCIVELPLPDGTLAKFDMINSQVMPPALAKQYPEIRSYSGRSVTDDQISVRLNFCPSGLRAQVFTPTEIFYIFSPTNWNGAYASVAKKDLPQDPGFQCLSSLVGPEEDTPRLASLGVERGGRHLRTYRIAIAASGEFTQANGGTVGGAMSAIVSTLNYVNGIYEKELGIRLQLIPNNNQIIFTNPNTDPYSANISNTTTLLENQNALDSIIGPGNYDIGHLFNTAEFGLAYIGVVCREGWKGRGCIGTSTPGGDLFFPDFAAHEIAHQFGAHHTFNSTDGNCSGSRNPESAYEPGSGSTLMAYAGFCNNDNLQAHGNTYFHSHSYDEIQEFVVRGSGATCAILTPTGNNPPVVDAVPHLIIPKGTPFKLGSSGYDPDGDGVTFCWEQRDIGPAQSVYESDNGRSPLFRSFEPNGNPVRFFPRMQELLNNGRLRGEQLPQLPREMHFRVTARDNKGGIATADTLVSVTDAGPLRVTSHNVGGTYFGMQVVRWDVAATHVAPINATHVNILLSTDGGHSFNVVLAANTPNDGVERILFPNEDIESARIKVEAANNVFFAINESAFNIQRYFTVSDFNFDGNVDLIWQNSRGQLASWFMNGTNFMQSSLLRDGFAAPAHLRLVGVADFNSDAQVDLLWHHLDGRLIVWFMNGAQLLGGQVLREGQRLNSSWRIVSATDLDGDAQPDILMHRNNGKLAVWKMNGTELVQAIPLRDGKPLATMWSAIGVSDFNADGSNDILLRNVDGRLAVWLMKGFEFFKSQNLNTPRAQPGAKLGSLADLDRNGQNDLIWITPDSRIQVWFMGGANAIRYGTLRNGSVNPQWQLMGPR